MDWIDGIRKQIEEAKRQFDAEMADTFRKKIDDANKAALEEFGEYQPKRIRELFKEAVEAWYGGYSPDLYERQGSGGSGGLFDILNISYDESNPVEYEPVDLLYDEDALTGRGGYNLFETVFKEGYHGGAKSGPYHPSGGTPYWRKLAPEYVKESGPKWMQKPWQRWSQPAESSESADSLFRASIALEEPVWKLELQELVDKHSEVAMNDMRDNIEPALVKKYFGRRW